MKKKIAVVLFNLGGPDKLSSVKAFLFNLFYDPAIITLPNPFRFLLAKFISSRREKKAQNIYQQIGGKSPIYQLTLNQAKLLENKLNLSASDEDFKTFIAMRYWHPFSEEAVEEVIKYQADQVVFLPLYPQYSTTTSNSSFVEFLKLWQEKEQESKKIKISCCYFADPLFIKAHVELIKNHIKEIKSPFRILFSAHGLPEYIIKLGDPYQYQIEQTVKLIMKQLGNFDYKICYQSKVGPLKWLKPATEDELIKAAKEGINIVVVPIAFVSDHSETLVELDIEYQELFKKHSSAEFIRVPALNSNELFIDSLFNQVVETLENKNCVAKCPQQFKKCYLRG